MLWRDLFKFGIFMLMLSIRIRNWCVCSGYASVPDSHAQRTHQFLTRMLRVHISYWCLCSAFFEGNALCTHISTWHAQCTHQFLTRMLSVRISSWRAYSVHASVPDAHAQCTHQFLTRMLRVYQMNMWKIGKLMRLLSMRVRNWCVCSGCASVFATCSGCASVPDPSAQRAHKGRSMRIRNSIFSIIFKLPKTSKIKKNR